MMPAHRLSIPQDTARQQRLRVRLLWGWSVTLAASNVAHYLGSPTLGYGVALAVQMGLCVYGVVQLWRVH